MHQVKHEIASSRALWLPIPINAFPRLLVSLFLVSGLIEVISKACLNLIAASGYLALPNKTIPSLLSFSAASSSGADG